MGTWGFLKVANGRSLPNIFLLIVPLAWWLCACQQPNAKVKVGFLMYARQDQDVEWLSAYHVLDSLPGFEAVVIGMEELLLSQQILSEVEILWYHRPDTGWVEKMEKEIGQAIKDYMTAGGEVLLSLDAVKLPYAWGIETVAPKVQHLQVIDEGYGRKLGYHAYRSHPVFQGLHGGAYVWHAKKDHMVRKLGYFEDQVPLASGAKVIGVDWSYITFHERSKLLWETPYGEGKMLAAGAYTYFSEENFNQSHLHLFLANALRYLNGDLDHEKQFYWDYNSLPVTEGNVKFEPLNPKPSYHWDISEPLLQATGEASNHNSWDLAGKRMLVMGKEPGGIEEVWTHPIMSLRDFTPGLLLPGMDSVLWLHTLQPLITSRPDGFIRQYRVDSLSLKEITTVSGDQPVAVIHYEWEGQGLEQLVFKVKSNLRLMWPYSSQAIGTLHQTWSEALNALVIYDRSGDFNILLGFNRKPNDIVKGQFEDFSYGNGRFTGIASEKKQIAALFSFPASGAGQMDVVIASGNVGLHDTEKLYREVLEEPSKVWMTSQAYYQHLLDNTLSVQSPDPIFNEGYRWAVVGTDQFMAETPGLGTSLMAGYASSAWGWNGGHAVSGRPGYAWYFGRDAVWSSFAVNAYGDFDKVQQVLRNFDHYQDPDGKIYHELTTSGAVHYDASDATPLYVLLAAHYLEFSGDKAFIEALWPSIEKAMDYSYSTDTDGDGFIENTNVGHGWIEGGQLYGAHTTFYLAGLWAATLKAAAYLAENVGEVDAAYRYTQDADRTKGQLNSDFWNPETSFFHYGKGKDGVYNPEVTILPAVPVYLGVIDQEKAQSVSAVFASNEFSADWGVRILQQRSALYQPSGYHYGSVWPLFSGWAALAEYHTGRYEQGFAHLMNNLLIYRNWNRGAIEEVLHGELYQPSGVCGHQCWSETMVLQPLLEGMLGLKGDAPSHRLRIAPRFPWHWDHARIERIRLVDHVVNLTMQRSSEETIYTLTHQGKGTVYLDLHPAFPVGTRFNEVFINGSSRSYTLETNPQECNLLLNELPLRDTLQIVVLHRNGIGVIPHYFLPDPGERSQGFRITGQELQGNTYNITVEGQPGARHSLQIYTSGTIRKVEGATIVEKEGLIYTLEIPFDDMKDQNYISQIIKIVLTQT